MTWFEDLSLWRDLPYLRAVGWLSRGTPFTTGDVPEEWFERLCQLLQNPWGPGPVAAGVHKCDLCQFTGGPDSSSYRCCNVPSRSASELYVPAGGFLYISPVSIAHYIDGHGYLPPEDFRRAVMECPSMHSIAYFKALLSNGGRELMRAASQQNVIDLEES